MKNIIGLLVAALLGGPVVASELPGALVDAEWLVENRDGVEILDVRKNLASFEKGHIPRAVLVDVTRMRVEREANGIALTRMRPDAAGFERFARAHGIDNDSIVVITHPGETPGQLAGAARLYWHFKYFGFDRVALLDGGNRAWVAALEDLVDDSSPVEPGDYDVGAERPEILAEMIRVRAALTDESMTLIDTRELRYHIGLEKKNYVYAVGHIPGSRNLPYQFLTPARQGTGFFDADYYFRLVDVLRIDRKNQLIVYCNSAYEASSGWFVLHEILGLENVRLYDGSLHEWTKYDANPMETRLAD